jgi:hypothetical protein
MLMVIARSLRPAVNPLNIHQSLPGLHCLLPKPLLSLPRKHTQRPSNLQDCQQQLSQLLPRVFQVLNLLRVHLSPLKATHNSANMADMRKVVLKNHRHCPKSHTMPSANRLHRLRVPLKATPTSQRPLKHPLNLELSHPRHLSILLTTLLTSSETPIKITRTTMDYRGKVLKASKMVQARNSVHSVGTTVLNQRDHLNSRKALLSKPPLVMLLLERVRPAVTLLPTHPLNLNNLELAKPVLNPNLATHNNQATTLTATLTSAPTMLPI